MLQNYMIKLKKWKRPRGLTDFLPPTMYIVKDLEQ